MTKQRTYSLYTKQAALLLAVQIKFGRKQRKWTETNLAQRAGISRSTLQKIENGEMNCAIGLVFEVAALVGVDLFNHETTPLSKSLKHAQDKLALLPQRIKTKNKVIDDGF